MLQSADTSLSQVIVGGLLGLFGGAGATLLWEGIFRPYRDRRIIARVLATEILINQQAVGRTREDLKDGYVPMAFQTLTITYQSIASRLAELPEELLPEIVSLYERFTRLNTAAAYVVMVQNSIDAGQGGRVEDLQSGLAGLEENLKIVTPQIDRLLPKLVRYSGFTSEPWVALSQSES